LSEHRLINAQIALLGPSMKINPEKTEVSTFQLLPNGKLICDKPATYLGLTFDGSKTYLRGRTLSRYYRRMTYATRGATRAAKQAGSSLVYKRKLYRDLSHLGSQNFYSYAKKAAILLGDSSPVRQLRNHIQILRRKITRAGR
jgi:RNA-directed DNA polymerase